MTVPSPERRKRIVVIGGGINGLAAAWSAWEASRRQQAEVWLLEAAARVGGKARTRREEGWLFEEGPTGYLSGEPILDELIARAQLEPVAANRNAARRYVVRGGRAREIVPTPAGFVKSGILSPLGLLRMAREPWVPRRSGGDESIWDFAHRRLGREVAERLIAPMVLGIFAGDARKLSLPAAFPRMRELEDRYGSLFRAMFLLAVQRKREAAQGRGPGGGPAGPGGQLYSFAEGMQSLPLALAARAPFEVRCNTRVSELAHDPASAAWRFRVDGAEGAHFADAVVLCCDAHTTAGLLQPTLPALSEELAAMTFPGLAVVGLGYDSPRSINRLPTGFGVLIPRGEGFHSLGCLFDTQLFAGRSPKGRMLVRCMLGGATDAQAASLPEKELVRLAIDDLRRLFDLPDPPTTYEVARWDKAIPQYELGHLERVERCDAELGRFAVHTPGLFVAGCHARGVAFGKTAKEGWRVGELAARALVRA
jgi:oxygen-dependent protoporphyrinogen oxidase